MLAVIQLLTVSKLSSFDKHLMFYFVNKTSVIRFGEYKYELLQKLTQFEANLFNNELKCIAHLSVVYFKYLKSLSAIALVFPEIIIVCFTNRSLRMSK